MLADAAALGIDSEMARRRLVQAASRARPKLELGKLEAEQVRALSLPQPVAGPEIGSRLVVPVPPPLLARARGRISASRLCAAAVPGMVAWKLAALLDGRTMIEWALLTLAKR